MTEQQSRIKALLFDLLENHGKYIRLKMYTKEQVKRNSSEAKTKTEAVKAERVVFLTLVEPDFPIELDQWAEALVKTEEYLGILEKERFWSYTNPNFFQAILNEVYGKDISIHS